MYGIYYHPEKYGVDVPQREPDERYEGDVYRVEFFLGFLRYIKEHGSPIDFFSWHSYAKVEKTLMIDRFIHQRLTEYGYGTLERHLNEWNNAHSTVWYGKSYASAANAAMMCAMQNSHTDMLCYYDARLAAGNYSGFFAPFTRELTCTYYAFRSFGELYTLKNQVLCEISDGEEGLYAVAASDGERRAMMIVNHSEESRQLSLDVDESFSVYLLKSAKNMSLRWIL
jgi:hypothetical protein